MKNWGFFAIAGAMAATAAMPAAAQDYKIGVSGAITGPVATTYAPVYEGLKVYLDRLNEQGGVNGHKVNAVYLNNQGAPPIAVSDSKRLIDEEKVLAVINISTSATYAPMVADARRTKTPLIFMGSAVCPQDVFPPKPDPYLFCTSFDLLGEDAKAIVHFLNELTGAKKAKLGLLAMDIPISRQGVDQIETLAGQNGFQVVGKVVVPLATADFTPFATRFKEASAEWITHWAPFTIGVAMFNSLAKLAWKGSYLSVASPTAEADMAKFAQPNFLVMPSYSFTVDGLPVFKEIADAARKYQATYAADALALGWVGGMVVEAALKGCGWPCDSEKLRNALERVNVDTKGLYGGPVDWSPANHVRSNVYYKLYGWDSGQNKVVRLKDWIEIPIR